MSRRWWLLLNLVVDAVALNAAIVLAFVLRFGWPVPEFNFSAYLAAAAPITLGQLLILALVDLYVPTADRSGGGLLWTVTKGIVLGGLVLVTLTFFLRAFAFPRVVILSALAIQVVLLWGWRVVAAGGLRIRWPERRVLLVGDLDDCYESARRLEGMKHWGYRVVGMVGTDDGPADPAALGDALEHVMSLPTHLDLLRPDQIIFVTPSRHREALEQVALSRTFEGDIYVVPQLYEMHLGEVNFSLLGDIPLLRLSRAGRSGPLQGLKSWLERVGAAVVLLVASPVLLLVSVLVLATSGPPVIYRQTRVGRDFRPFTLYKFRTMVKDAEAGSYLVRLQPRLVTWRKTWGHIIECRLCRSRDASEMPSALWSPHWAMQRLDVVRSTGIAGLEPQRRVMLKEELDECHRQSSPGFAASTLGL